MFTLFKRQIWIVFKLLVCYHIIGGKWVIDTMYNVDAFQCVDCVPWTEKLRFCSCCGAKASENAEYCSSCGKRLAIGKGSAYD